MTLGGVTRHWREGVSEGWMDCVEAGVELKRLEDLNEGRMKSKPRG